MIYPTLLMAIEDQLQLLWDGLPHGKDWIWFLGVRERESEREREEKLHHIMFICKLTSISLPCIHIIRKVAPLLIFIRIFCIERYLSQANVGHVQYTWRENPSSSWKMVNISKDFMSQGCMNRSKKNTHFALDIWTYVYTHSYAYMAMCSRCMYSHLTFLHLQWGLHSSRTGY